MVQKAKAVTTSLEMPPGLTGGTLLDMTIPDQVPGKKAGKKRS